MTTPLIDAVVVGAGPNGLSAAITLAKAGLSVRVLEAQSSIGGGARSAELTLPGFRHDVCSAVYPMAIASPFFRALPLHNFGLEWIQPPIALAHPFDHGDVTAVMGQGDATIGLGPDAAAWSDLFATVVGCGPSIFDDMLRPLSFTPRHPVAMARFGLNAAKPATKLSRKKFSATKARALFAGIAAHSGLDLNSSFSAATGLALGAAAHISGWPVARGGAQALSNALADYFRSLGGVIELSTPVKSLSNLPAARVVMLDISALQAANVGADVFPRSYVDALQKFRPCTAVFKVDWALSQPVPWENSFCRKAGTLHLGGTEEEIVAAEKSVAMGKASDRPYVLLSQPSLFDPTRAPPTQHTLWAYCHIPLGSEEDQTTRIENQIERFAPGFRDCILGKHVFGPAAFESYNANLVGGDISGGAMNWPQIFKRPTSFFNPYRTPVHGMYLCSSSTPPGTGVHGMSGYWAARAALKSIGK